MSERRDRRGESRFRRREEGPIYEAGLQPSMGLESFFLGRWPRLKMRWAVGPSKTWTAPDIRGCRGERRSCWILRFAQNDTLGTRGIGVARFGRAVDFRDVES